MKLFAATLLLQGSILLSNYQQYGLFADASAYLSLEEEESKELALISSLPKPPQDLSSIDDESDGFTPMILGKQLDNPFSMKNVMVAAERIQWKGRIAATHKYVKISPSTEDDLDFMEKMEAMDDDRIILHDHPLDYEVLEEGDYYVDPDNKKGIEYSSVYALLPIDFVLPKSLPVVLLDEIYEPSDEDEELELSLLDAAGYDPDSVYPSLLDSETKLRGTDEGHRRQLIFGRRYRPQGCVYVWDTSVNGWSPLRQAKISIGRNFFWRWTHTNDDGCFRSPKKYRGRVAIRLKWKSNIGTMRKSWNEMMNIRVSDSLMTIKRRTNPRNAHITLDDDRRWMKSTVHNGLVLYNDYAAAQGISRRISGANVWVWANGGATASAPMLNKYRQLASMSAIAGLTQGSFWQGLVNFILSFLVSLVPSRYRPDLIFSGIRHYRDTRRVHQLVFHEAGHFSHALQAGAWYWAKVVAAEVTNSIFHGGPYGDGTDPDFASGELIGVAEGWATLTEILAMRSTYGICHTGATGGPVISNVDHYIETFVMNSVPMTRDREKDDGWFLHGLFFDCIDDMTETWGSRYVDGQTGALIGNIDDQVAIVDTASGEVFPIFRYLTSSTRDACDFGNKLVVGYPPQGQAIADLFASYGFACVTVPSPTPPPPPPSPTPGPPPPRPPVCRFPPCNHW